MIVVLSYYLPFFSASSSKQSITANRTQNSCFLKWGKLEEENLTIRIMEDLDVSHFADLCQAHSWECRKTETLKTLPSTAFITWGFFCPEIFRDSHSAFNSHHPLIQIIFQVWTSPWLLQGEAVGDQERRERFQGHLGRAVRTLLWLWKAGQEQGAGNSSLEKRHEHRAGGAGAFPKQMGLVLKLPGEESRTKKSFPELDNLPEHVGTEWLLWLLVIWRRREEALSQWVMDWLLTISISAATCHTSSQYLYINICRFFGFPFCPRITI